ncbi:MAG: hypothetical protein HXY26_10435 [Hydrogenophilaceae bacterium]|nr:hypothetical protein [Hydrogenophilaceae bacterium]
MSKPDSPAGMSGNRAALARTLRAFVQMLPIVLGMLLLTSLILAWLPRTGLQSLFGRHESLDVLLGAVIGSVAMGHPLAGYLLGGELLAGGVSLIAVTALIVTWVTVGVVQLPAEALLLGRRFALWRNLLCFLSAIAIAYLTVAVLRLLG